MICLSLLNVFGTHFAFLGVTLVSLWLPRDAGGSLWGFLDSQGELLVIYSKMDTLFYVNLERLRCLLQKSCLAGLSADFPRIPWVSRNLHKVAQGPQLPTPLNSRRVPARREFETNSQNILMIGTVLATGY